jgi:uncharacterized protein YqeY
MTLKTKLQDDLRTAMRSGDRRRLAALRLTMSAIQITETAETRTTRCDLTDEQVITVIHTEVKRRRDTIAELE